MRESLHDFRLFEWAPFGWILLVQVLFLVAALNLGSVWGMALVGGVARLLGRSEELVHYPTVFVALPALASIVEWVLYVGAGSVLIPMALLRIAEPMEGGSRADWGVRIRRAAPPTLLAGLINIGLLQLWDLALSRGVAPAIQSQVRGTPGFLAPWFVGAVVSYVLATPFLFVPIRGIQRGSNFATALIGGVVEGIRLLWPAFLIVVLCSWPTLIPLAGAQINPAVVVRKMRPELVAYLLILYAAITSVATYLTYAAASRLHWSRQAEAGQAE